MSRPAEELDAAEIARRLPIWAAMAALFLDTDMPLFATHAAREIVEAGYTIGEAEDMLRWEVRPAFYQNLRSVAGEWAGWPDDLVRERVGAYRDNRSIRLLLGRNRYFPDDYWTQTVAEISRLQAASNAGSVCPITPPPSTRSPA